MEYASRAVHRRLIGVAALVGTIAVMVSCTRNTSPAAPDGGQWSISGDWTGRIIITSRQYGSPIWGNDPITIGGASIHGDTLALTVSFGGGCSEHSFALLSDGAWMESYPVQIRVRLAHDAHDDVCDALLSRTLKFDLTPLRQAYQASYQSASGQAILRLAGASTSPLYTF